MKVEVYLRPKDSPFMYPEDTDIRINYNDHWIDFRDGKILFSREDSELGLVRHETDLNIKPESHG